MYYVVGNKVELHQILILCNSDTKGATTTFMVDNKVDVCLS